DFAQPAVARQTATSIPVEEIADSDEPIADNDTRPKGCQPCHRGMLVCLLIILGLSIPLVFSASTAFALDNGASSTYFLVRQIVFVLLGIGVMIGVSRMSRKALQNLVWVLYGLTVIGLIATKVSPLGYSQG